MEEADDCNDMGIGIGILNEWYYDEEKRIEAKAKRRLEKLGKLREEYHLRNVPLSKDADVPLRRRSEDSEDEGGLTVVKYWLALKYGME